jgi:hypothetical protein
MIRAEVGLGPFSVREHESQPFIDVAVFGEFSRVDFD